jgi:phenylacetate-coenzyme A ligase PaaK-like adenylate-forming protein
MEIFLLQAQNNAIYKSYLEAINIDWETIDSPEKIPFLPIEFFKSHEVKTGNFNSEIIYTSSGTSGEKTSRHHVRFNDIYRKSFMEGFKMFYGDPTDYVICALLPSYLERQGSSLIEMAAALIEASDHPDSGFFLHDHDRLAEILRRNEGENRKNFLLGVTFGLLDFAEKHSLNLPQAIVMETGGMKGKRREMIREEVAETLGKAFQVSQIHSEYGMTELLSQAYSHGDGIFECPPWMRVHVRDTSDPLCWKKTGNGALNIIDFANIHSCSFIATQDLGKVHKNGNFEVLGRMDHADIRGCNLLII